MADRKIVAVIGADAPSPLMAQIRAFADGGVELQFFVIPERAPIVLAEPRAFPEKTHWTDADDWGEPWRHDQYRYTSWFTTYLLGMSARDDAPSLCPAVPNA